MSTAMLNSIPYRPLHTQQAKHKCKPVVPPACLIHDTVRAEDILRGVHLVARRRRQKHDDDNYVKFKALDDSAHRQNELVHTPIVVPRFTKTKLVVMRASHRVARQF